MALAISPLFSSFAGRLFEIVFFQIRQRSTLGKEPFVGIVGDFPSDRLLENARNPFSAGVLRRVKLCCSNQNIAGLGIEGRRTGADHHSASLDVARRTDEEPCNGRSLLVFVE
jgi:hypothetical protein